MNNIFEHLTFHESGGYTVVKEIKYYSERYQKYVTVPVGFPTDGATCFPDIESFFWTVHDWLVNGKGNDFDDGSHCSNWNASMIAADILWAEKRYLLAPVVFVGVWVFGLIRQLFKRWLK